MRASIFAWIVACGANLIAAVERPAAAADAAGSVRPASTAASLRAAVSPTGLFLQVGTGSNANAQVAGLLWAWPAPVLRFAGGSLKAFTEVSIGRWSARNDGRGRAISTQIGIAPVLRYHFERAPSWFVEASIGVNVITPLYRSGNRQFSTVFNFGDQIGVGFRSPESGREWSLRYQHFSNGGIREPNPGQNFIQLRWTLPL
jgi:hypothetical protein